ncbi:uncharacterized protein LOC133199293 [Saccostrea echinata]|uniref:uncharacterized protein LOC133199293 n=1 Tax=Saccostrea echinata TaxID=191078 RepID=UPI002A80C798|nr:uncharacterized protein LOC133199293 [Saccostrea echinata]
MSDTSHADLSEDESSSASWNSFHSSDSSDSYIYEVIEQKCRTFQRGKKNAPQRQVKKGKALSGKKSKMAKKTLFTSRPTSTPKSVQHEQDLPLLEDSTCNVAGPSMSPTTCSSTSEPPPTTTQGREILTATPTTSVLNSTPRICSPATTPSNSDLGQHQGLFTKLRKLESQQERILEGQREIIILLSGNPSQKKGNNKVKIMIPNHVRTVVHDGYSHGNAQGLDWKMKSDDGSQTLKPSSDVNKSMTEHICQYVTGIYPDCRAFVKG